MRPVYWQAYAVVRDADEAEDVTQEVFITTWNKIGRITVVDESVLPRLLTTARFTALNARRGQESSPHQRSRPGLSDGSTVEDEVVPLASARLASAST